jgi:regulatory Fis family protein
MNHLHELPTLRERDDRYVRRVLLLCGGSVATAAAVLGMGRATLYRRVQKLGGYPSSAMRRPTCSSCGDWALNVRRRRGRLVWDCGGRCSQ